MPTVRRLSWAAWGVIALCGLSCSCNVPPPPAPVPVPEGIHNLHELEGRLLSGGNPEGDAAFAYLAARGVKHIVSVDGAKPDVAAARRHGITYIHIPVGYDGIDRGTQLKLARASELAGTLYIHCHHGKHRGPSAAAIIQRCRTASVTPDQSADFLKLAGTDPRYEGLHGAVKDFKKPTPAEMATVPTTLPESVDVGGIAEAMVQLDAIWDRLKSDKEMNWERGPVSSHVPTALGVVESYRETARLPETATRSDAFRQLLTAAERDAVALDNALRAGDKSAADAAFDKSAAHCTTCHQAYRDKRK